MSDDPPDPEMAIALEQTWASWPAADRSQCTDTAKMGAPSYVELLTCLQMQQDARKLKPSGL